MVKQEKVEKAAAEEAETVTGELEKVQPEKKQKESEKKAEAKKEARDAKSKQGRVKMAKIMEVKKKVFELEQTNTKRMYAFVSKGGWYKMGGRSALFYYHKIRNRIGGAERLLPDKDYYSTFEEGVVSFRNIESLEKTLEKNLKIVKNQECSLKGLLVTFELGYEISKEDIHKMEHDEEIKRANFNQMALPKVAMPDLNMEMWNVTKLLYPRLRKLQKREMKMVGEKMMEDLLRLQRAFYMMSVGSMGKREAVIEMLVRVQQLKCWMKMVLELKMWELDNAMHIMETLVKMERLLEKERKNGSR